jgi:regulator of protease activity HflC (stomatin/prohibitin superfamily)
LVGVGVRRRRGPNGELEPRAWGRLTAFVTSIVGVIVLWTSIHIVPPGSIGVPVTLGHPGKPLKPGMHLTLPLTTVHSMTVRTQNYTMQSSTSRRTAGNTDDSVSVLGADGGTANVNATVLFRLDNRRAGDVYRSLGTRYVAAIVRPSARACVRAVFTAHTIINAATTNWQSVRAKVADCMRSRIAPKGLVLQEFQLREVTLSGDLQTAVNAKVAAQQHEEQQKFELATAQQAANITRVQALATADSQQVLACGGHAATVTRNAKVTQTVIPNPIASCSQAQLTPAYLQFTYIQALKQLVNSPNHTSIVLPFDQNLTPLIDGSK